MPKRFSCSVEVVEIAGEYLAVPIGAVANSVKGVVGLNEVAAFLLRQMSIPKTKTELIDILTTNYDIDRLVAEKDIDSMIGKLSELGLLLEA